MCINGLCRVSPDSWVLSPTGNSEFESTRQESEYESEFIRPESESSRCKSESIGPESVSSEPESSRYESRVRVQQKSWVSPDLSPVSDACLVSAWTHESSSWKVRYFNTWVVEGTKIMLWCLVSHAKHKPFTYRVYAPSNFQKLTTLCKQPWLKLLLIPLNKDFSISQ